MANGSLALSAAYLAVGLGSGDEIITTPRTFIATASSAVLLGATPVFADVDPDSGSITAATIAPLITPERAISVVHLGGWPANMPAICDLARSHGIAVIEDCAQAHGARMAFLWETLVILRLGASVRTRFYRRRRWDGDDLALGTLGCYVVI